MILLDMKDYFYLLVNVDSDSVDDIVKVRRCSKRHTVTCILPYANLSVAKKVTSPS
jgi:hypothetical protein